MTFMTDIEAVATKLGEKVEVVLIGETWNKEGIPADVKDTPRAWEEVKHLLDYNYEKGYGSEDVHPIQAYTKSHIIFITEYDGATSIKSLPRNPMQGEDIRYF